MKKIFQLSLGLLIVLSLLFYFNIAPDISVEDLKKKYANEHSQFLEVDGMKVHYRDEGEGVPIVLVHGTAASLHTWDDWTQDLKKKYRVIRLDLPAFGLTGPHPKRDYHIKTYSAFLNKFVEQLNVPSFYLAGNSLGGEIAWFFASEHPEKVRKLVLLDPAGYIENRELPFVFQLAQTPLLNKLIGYITPKAFIQKNIEEVYFEDEKIKPELVTRYHEMSLRTGNRDAFIDRANTIKDPENIKRLPNIQTPTLIIWGKEDEWIPVAHGQRFVSDLPHAQLAVMEGVGHVPMEESPKESLEIAWDFLTK